MKQSRIILTKERRKALMKKIYLKPEATYVSFYSEEEITEINNGLEASEMSSVNLGDYDISDWS
jgi:ribonuclease HII